MNADEHRPGMVARCAKVDGAFLEGVFRGLKNARWTFARVDPRPLFRNGIAPERSTNRLERFTKSSLRLCLALPEVTDSRRISADDADLSR